MDEAALPYRNAVGKTYDSGGFGQCLRLALDEAEWTSFLQRRERSAAHLLEVSDEDVTFSDADFVVESSFLKRQSPPDWFTAR